MKDLIVYYRPGCPFSAGTVSFLLLEGADFRLVNLREHPEEKESLEARLGDRKVETPTLACDGELLVAPSLSELKRLLPEWGLSRRSPPSQQQRPVEEQAGPMRH